MLPTATRPRGLISIYAKSPTHCAFVVRLSRRHQRVMNELYLFKKHQTQQFSRAGFTIFRPVLTAILITGCADSQEPVAATDPVPRPALIATLNQPSNRILHEFVGKVDAAQTVDLSFEVSGQLTSLLPREGDRLVEGSLIAALDPTPFEISVRRQKLSSNSLSLISVGSTRS